MAKAGASQDGMERDKSGWRAQKSAMMRDTILDTERDYCSR